MQGNLAARLCLLSVRERVTPALGLGYLTSLSFTAL